jgi:hypothetical protein
MASTESTITNLVIERDHAKYHWPAQQLNFWILVMLAGSATNLGVFAYFMTIQTRLVLGIPWYVVLFRCLFPAKRTAES